MKAAVRLDTLCRPELRPKHRRQNRNSLAEKLRDTRKAYHKAKREGTRGSGQRKQGCWNHRMV
jgi:hypothetical protein